VTEKNDKKNNKKNLMFETTKRLYKMNYWAFVLFRWTRE